MSNGVDVGAAAPEHSNNTNEISSIAIARLVIGLAQGLILYGLYRAVDAHTWPALNPLQFAPIAAFVLFIPLFVTQALGSMHLRSLALWTLLAGAVVVGLAWYDRYRAAIDLVSTDGSDKFLVPSFGMMFFTFAGLFIAQALVTAGDTDKSFLTRYRTYFDATWKFGVQMALAGAFVGAFWLLLYLGSFLFRLIKIDVLKDLIEHAWFAIPATTLAVAAALHLTDVQARLVAGIRTVALTLLSWLLPLMTLLVGAFVLALIGTGLEPLWETRSASSLLLIASATLVVLINAAYQDGESGGTRHPVLRYTTLVAALALVPLVSLAAYALALRVQEYGWTVDRIATLACVLVAACYALGYTAAALFSLLGGQWMWALESVNIFLAFLILALLLALFTPAADPARLSVESQVSRLEAGTVAPSQFDFFYLKNEGGRFGDLELHRLAKLTSGPHAAEISYGAKVALGMPIPIKVPEKITPAQILANLAVYPAGKQVPASFLDQLSNSMIVGCPYRAKGQCNLLFADVDGDGADEIVMFTVSDSTDPSLMPGLNVMGTIQKPDDSGTWQTVGTFDTTMCKKRLDDIRAGKFELKPPPTDFREIVVNGQRVTFQPNLAPTPPKCG